jgi:Domain of unknown function (DUF5615)
MPLCFLLDEHFRGGAIWKAIAQHNALGVNVLDILRVGDPPDLPLGSHDPDIFRWCSREGRILVSLDKRTLPGFLAAHRQAGGHVPGVLLVRPTSQVAAVLGALVLVAHAGNPMDYIDTTQYIP